MTSLAGESLPYWARDQIDALLGLSDRFVIRDHSLPEPLTSHDVALFLDDVDHLTSITSTPIATPDRLVIPEVA